MYKKKAFKYLKSL